MNTDILQFEALFNHATIGIIVTNKEGKIVNFNRHAESQFGYTEEELTGKTVDLLVPVNMPHAHHKLREGFYAHPQPRRMGEGRDLFARQKNGSEFPVEISLSSYEIKGEIFVIAFVIDITVRKKSEALVLEQRDELRQVNTEVKKLNTELEQKVDYRTRMLRETLAELEKSKEELNNALEKEKELNELKSRFVTTASHEFRTPLSTILSSAYLLDKYNEIAEPLKRAKHIQRIKTAVTDMKTILEDFLSIGKLEEGLTQVNFQEFSPTEMASECSTIINDIEALLKKGQKIQLKSDGESPILIDRQLFKHILSNLIQNAIKFSPENSNIDIRYQTSPEGLSLSITDHGIGISEEDQQHLFERFFRAKNALNIQGTGLGLHIVSKYLELMNGNISLQSKLDQGSTFTIHIPKN